MERKLIAGLLTLFSEKVRERIRESHGGTIPYNTLTFGEIISYITREGLMLCTDLKLKYKVMDDTKRFERELGSFCSQYGLSKPNFTTLTKGQKVFKEKIWQKIQ